MSSAAILSPRLRGFIVAVFVTVIIALAIGQAALREKLSDTIRANGLSVEQRTIALQLAAEGLAHARAPTQALRNTSASQISAKLALLDQLQGQLLAGQTASPAPLVSRWIDLGPNQLRQHQLAQPRIDHLRKMMTRLTRIDDPEQTMYLGTEVLRFVASDLHPALSAPDAGYTAAIGKIRARTGTLGVALVVTTLLAFGVAQAMILCPILLQNKVLCEKRRIAEVMAAKASFTDRLSGLPNAEGLQVILQDAPADARWRATAFEYSPALSLSGESKSVMSARISEHIGKKLLASDVNAIAIGQIGTDRFVAIFDDAPPGTGIPPEVDFLAGFADEPLDLDGMPTRVIFSGGVGYKRQNRSAGKMVDDAVVALKVARAERSGTRLYVPEMRRDMIIEKRVLHDLRLGIMSGQIRAHFQPQIDIATGALLGVEALARWDHPTRGLLPPGKFLALAKDTGLDEPIGESVLRLGLQALVEWDARGWDGLTLGINLAQSQLQNTRLVELIKWELDRFEIAPNRLAVEVLENVYVECDDHIVVRNLAALSAMGVRIDLDDFGTGTASITGIQRFHTNRVKIDRSYISDIHLDPAKQSLVRAIVRMAESLGIETLAEGVEEPSELAWLKAVGCSHVQGFHLARPMPLDECHRWIEFYLDRLAAKPDPCEASPPGDDAHAATSDAPAALQQNASRTSIAG